jgi:hypothetical protein
MAVLPAETTGTDAEAHMREAFEARLRHIVHNVARNAEIGVIASVLAEPSSLGAVAETLSLALTLDAPSAPLAAARARGVAARERLIKRAGGIMRISEVAEMMNISRAAVHGRRGRGNLLAVPLPNGEEVFPACQFTGKGVPGGLGEFLSAFPEAGPWTKLSVLLAPSRRHEGKSALDLLKAGRVDDAVGIAARHGEHLG